MNDAANTVRAPRNAAPAATTPVAVDIYAAIAHLSLAQVARLVSQ